MTRHLAHNAAAASAVLEAPFFSWDARLQLPAALLAGSVLAAGAFAALHFTVGRRLREKAQREPVRSDLGFVFPESGVVLCPATAGIEATTKEIKRGSFVVLWLADPQGKFVQTTWAKVLAVDETDPKRIFVILTGEMTRAGQKALDPRHGFGLSQVFWMTKDCVPEVYEGLVDARAALLCGAQLETFDGDGDGKPDGYAPAKPPANAVEDLVGREVELLLVSRAGKGTAWQATLVAMIMGTGKIGQIATVKVLEVGETPLADHGVSPGDVFDVAWDCITKYRS